jgi:hypothetical protein
MKTKRSLYRRSDALGKRRKLMEADGSLDPFSVNLRVLATFFVEIIK